MLNVAPLLMETVTTLSRVAACRHRRRRHSPLNAVICCLALGIFPVFGGSPLAPVRLYVQFQRQPPDVVMDVIQEELESILFPVGLGFEWRSLSGTKGDEVSVELAVIHFKGNCSVSDLAPIEAQPGSLGWTHISDGEIIPFSDIDCDAIRWFLQRELLRTPEANREPVYGRAIARVLAHELYHIFTKATKHGAWGIGKSAFTVQELLSTSFQFEKNECDLLRAWN